MREFYALKNKELGEADRKALRVLYDGETREADRQRHGSVSHGHGEGPGRRGESGPLEECAFRNWKPMMLGFRAAFWSQHRGEAARTSGT